MNDKAARVGSELKRRGLRLITAESCTGGLIAATLTEIPGSSNWLEGAFVTYRVSAKQRMLGVSQDTLRRHSAVSEPVAREMATAALERSGADVSVAVTGVAGPTGGDVIAPLGRVWLAFAMRQRAEVQALKLELHGDRKSIRQQAVTAALDGLLDLLAATQRD